VNLTVLSGGAGRRDGATAAAAQPLAGVQRPAGWERRGEAVSKWRRPACVSVLVGTPHQANHHRPGPASGRQRRASRRSREEGMRSVAAAVLAQAQQGGKGASRSPTRRTGACSPRAATWPSSASTCSPRLGWSAAPGSSSGRDPGRRRRVQPDPPQRRPRQAPDVRLGHVRPGHRGRRRGHQHILRGRQLGVGLNSRRRPTVGAVREDRRSE
jgi:hypothetical protein